MCNLPSYCPGRGKVAGEEFTCHRFTQQGSTCQPCYREHVDCEVHYMQSAPKTSGAEVMTSKQLDFCINYCKKPCVGWAVCPRNPTRKQSEQVVV